MNKITAPYNFVPLNKHVYVPDWGEQVTQDIPFSDGEDGIIEVKWRNVSPLCIRDASDHKKVNGCEAYYSMNVKQDDKRLFFIPGSSLRGMLRNTLNIMSFGKMTQYDGSKHFGYRGFATVPLESFGWLKKKGEKYYLYPTDYDSLNDARPITDIEFDCKGKYDNDDYSSAWVRNEFIRNSEWGKANTDSCRCYFPIVHWNKRDCALFATGRMRGKVCEPLIPLPNGTGDKLDDNVIASFKRMYENTPDVEHFLELLEGGTQIPVSYMTVVDKNGNETYALGLSHMLRQPYKHSVADLVRKGQKEVQDRDLSELIFGFVDERTNKTKKGRVQIGNAIASEPMTDEELETKSHPVKGVLGEPKASYWPLYIKQDNKGSQYKTYDNGEISGRKFYRIHQGGSVEELPTGNDNEETVSRMIPVPAGQEFTMRIVVHNLREVEVGALLSAILHHCTKGVYHNIGSAKGYGYGKLECTNDDVTLSEHFKYAKDEYMKAFEREMDRFMHDKNKQKNDWCDSAELMRMMAILSEHDNQIVRMMVLEDYTSAKKQKTKFDYEGERKGANTFLLLERNYPEYATDKEEVRQLLDSKEWLRAKDKQKAIIDRIQAISRDVPELQTEQSTLESIEKQLTEQLKQANNKKIIDLPERLNERFEQQDRYKVNTWKICNSKVTSWLKKPEHKTLNEEELNALAETIRRLYKNPDKKEKKDWGNQESNLWKQVAGFLGQDRADSLYKEYKELHG